MYKEAKIYGETKMFLKRINRKIKFQHHLQGLMQIGKNVKSIYVIDGDWKPH